MDRRVLITGISGFAGSNLAKYLLDGGVEVFGIMRRRADWTKPRNLKALGIVDEVSIVEADLLDLSSLAGALDCEPDVVFHLAAQSYVPRSFTHPLETAETNGMGTANLLEAIRLKDLNPKVVFAGTSEEYGLVVSSHSQYEALLEKYGVVFPEPQQIPELPISERNPLRPMSPYAASKVYGEKLMTDYYYTYGLDTVVSRGFNHEGAGRGRHFVTSVITSQVMALKLGLAEHITIGNVNAFRDWSHVMDIVRGYVLLSQRGRSGDVYNQGSQRTNSILSYLLLSLEETGYGVDFIETFKGEKRVDEPTAPDTEPVFHRDFDKTRIDRMLLEEEVSYTLSDGGLRVHTQQGVVSVEFDKERFRPSEVPILMADTEKIQGIGFRAQHSLQDIIRDQLNYYMDKKNLE